MNTATTAATVPFWVYAILVAVLSFGYRQSLPRSVKPGPIVALAFVMLALSLQGVIASFGVAALPLAAWAIGVGAALTLLGERVAPRGLRAEGGRVHVPGSWLPLALMMGIFCAKFLLGFATAVGASLLHEPVVAALASGIFGLLSGSFAVRALAIHRAAQSLA